MALVISLVARKGGVGKTTIAANLAAELERLGAKTRLIDTDPQRSLWSWANEGKGFLSSRVVAMTAEAESSVRDAVRNESRKAGAVVIDTAPGFTPSALRAVAVSDLVLLPCGASPLDLTAARDAVQLFRQMRSERPESKFKLGLVPSRYLLNCIIGRELTASLAQLGERTLPGITHRIALAEAAITGLTIGEYAPSSAAHRQFKAFANAVWSYLHEESQSQKSQAQSVTVH